MTSDSQKFHRRSIRLQGYDYAAAGAYFVTICAHERQCLFGEIVNFEMVLSDYGRIIEQEWVRTGTIRPNVEIDEYVTMPNHLHGIIIILDPDNGHGRGTLQRAPTRDEFGKPQSNSIPTIVRLFKSTTTKQINVLRNMPGAPVWQRNYYEHIIRNDQELNRIREYILNNPAKWQEDRENPAVFRQRH